MLKIVPAGVEHDQPQAPGTIGRGHQPLQRDRLVVGIAVASKPGIDWYEIVGVADFEAMTGIIDHGDIRLISRVLELADCTFEIEVADIEHEVDGIEPGILEHFGHRARVTRGIGQLRHRLVARIADNQRHPLVRQSVAGSENHRQDGRSDHGRHGQETLDHLKTSARAAGGPHRSFPNHL